jgi:hypothetical protein
MAQVAVSDGKLQITVLEEYCGEYSVITGAYSKDLLLDVID